MVEKKLANSASKAERESMIDRDKKELSIKTQAKLLSLNRTSIYYKPVGPSKDEIEVKDHIHLENPAFASRKITSRLKREVYNVNRKRVQRYMREMGIIAVYPGPNLSKRNQEHKVYPYLLRNVDPSLSNQVRMSR